MYNSQDTETLLTDIHRWQPGCRNIVGHHCWSSVVDYVTVEESLAEHGGIYHPLISYELEGSTFHQGDTHS